MTKLLEIKVSPERPGDPRVAVLMKAITEARLVPHAFGRTRKLKAIAEKYKISFSTLKRALARVEKGEPIFKERKPQGYVLPGLEIETRAWDPEAARIAAQAILGNKRNHVEKLALYEQVKAKAGALNLRIGGYRSFLNIAWKINPAIKIYRDQGVRGLREEIVPAIQRDFTAYRPMECLVGDQHKADYYAVTRDGEICTLELFVWMDFRTQLVWPSIAYRHYNKFVVGQALINACRWGLPLMLYCDWGKPEQSNYVSYLREQIGGLGIKAQSIRHVHAKVRHPQAKPIEGWFSWYDRALRNEKIPGYMKRQADTRENELQQKELKQLDRCGELLGVEELVERVTAAIEKWNCHHFKNRGVDTGKSPLEIYQEETLETPVTCLSNDVLEYVFLPVQDRVVRRSQVKVKHEWLGTLTYYDPELANHQGAAVSIRYNPFEPNRAWVFKRGGKFLCCAEEWGMINPKNKDHVMDRIQKQNSLIKQIREKYQAYVPEGKTVKRIHSEERAARALAASRKEIEADRDNEEVSEEEHKRWRDVFAKKPEPEVPHLRPFVLGLKGS
jgi:hypothetical protein